ncbi:MAG: peptidylprolyl isomerase [Phycisphaerae bacterium]|jgi:peptidyl-prolyl cis-trans isomerase C
MNSFKKISIAIVLLSLTVGVAEAAKKKDKKKKDKAVEVNAPAESKAVAAETPKPPVTESKQAPAAEATPVKDANMSDVTAISVNGTKIAEGQITKMLNARMEQLASRIPPNMKDQYSQQLRKRIVEQLVIEELLAQKERAKNIAVTQADVNEQVNKQMEAQNLTIDEFKSLLKAYGTTYSEFEANMRKKLMFEKLIEGEFAGKIVNPTDEQIKAYYDENAQQFSAPERIHAKHILITPAESNDPNNAKAAAKAKAEDLLKQLKAGADFNDLAKANSSCPSAKNGGDLGGLQPRGTFVPEFEKAAYALQPGQMSDIVETEFGFHIIKLVEHADANTISLEKAKGQIVQLLTNKQKEGIVISYIQQLKQEADLKFTNPADNFDLDMPKPAAPVRTSSPDKNEPNSKK